MKINTVFWILIFSITNLKAASAEMEFKGLFGECFPYFASSNNTLELYKDSNIASEKVIIPYRTGWRIPVEGLTRVKETGSLRVTTPDEKMYCSRKPSDGPNHLIAGEIVEYLHYVAEGSGAIRFRGGECTAEVNENFGHFEVIELPQVEIWLHVFYADGTSPGWLLLDSNEQAYVAGVKC